MSFSSSLEPRSAHTVHKRHGSMKRALQARASTCTDSGDLYTMPAPGANIDSSKDTTISWNPDCLNSTSQIDIYLYAPLQPSASLPIHAWTRVPVSDGSYSVKLAPKWWNATASVELSLNIVPAGNQPWDSSFSYGPAWYATYTAPTDGSAPPADAVVGSSDSDKLISIFYKAGQLTSGGMAAAIVVPLIVVAIALGIYIRKLHLNRNNKLADWAEHMDKRMSKISLDWTSGGDGRSGAVPGSRPASFVAQPNSTYRPSMEAVRAQYAASVAGHTTEEMSEAHHGTESMYSTGARQSNYRVSFAPSTAAGHASAGHQNHNLKVATGSGNARSSLHHVTTGSSALPTFDTQQFNDNADDDSLIMSPTQNQGATPFNFEVLRKSMDDDMRKSMLNYPAVEMMDGQDQQEKTEEHVENVAEEHDEASSVIEHGETDQDAYATDAGVVSDQTGMLPPSSADSPDEALKQYAALRTAAGSTPTGPSPSPAPMRNLYGVPQAQSSNSLAADSQFAARLQSFTTAGGSSINEDDVVGYNEMIDGHQRK
ncbi:hypothetical protein CBS101457_005124 [Exobasidium rhododendri]|nr:hypothetical protein CBS101457_005124 [Exobasidium rhododendri]